MRLWRTQPKDDQELMQETGIKPPNHTFVTPDYIQKMERKMLGPRWYKKRPPAK